MYLSSMCSWSKIKFNLSATATGVVFISQSSISFAEVEILTPGYNRWSLNASADYLNEKQSVIYSDLQNFDTVMLKKKENAPDVNAQYVNFYSEGAILHTADFGESTALSYYASERLHNTGTISGWNWSLFL